MSENDIQGKALVSDNVLDRSVQEQQGFVQIPGSNDFVLQISTIADDILPWGRDVWRRDRELRKFWPTEPYVASAINTIVAARANMSWSLDGPPRTVGIIQRMLQSSNLGKGWLDLQSKVCADMLTQDNGAFVEIVRQEDKPNSPVLNLNHLDSGRCVRTGMDEYPVIYYDRIGREHKLAWYQVLTFEDMPSPVEEMNSVQYCFLTRILRGAQILRDISVYKREKLSGRNPGEIHLVSGVQTKLVEDKLGVAHEHATNQGFARYMLPIVLGSLDPNASVASTTIALKNLPDGFDEDTTLRWYISLLAMGAGADYQDFAPLPSGNIGSGQQSEILHRKARGKGHATWRKLWEHKLNFFGILPQSVDFSFDEKDIESDIQEAELKDKKAKTYSTYYDKGTGVLPLNVIHQMMADDGILKPEYLAMLGEEDATTDIVATDDERAPTETEIEEASQPTETAVSEEVPIEVRSKDSKNDINYGWVGLEMPTYISLLALGVGASIDQNDLHEIGIEDESHVTVKYGFEDGVTSEMCANKVKSLLPVTVKLGKFSLFENDEFDVFKVEIESEKLRMMNKRLGELPNSDTHPQYNPHMTIAYLKPGAGKKYLSMANPFDGRFVQIDELQFSDKNENKTTIPGLKKNKQIESDVSEFEDEFQALSEEALNGDISQAAFLDEAGILVAQQVMLAFLEGSGKTINQLTDSDRAIIQQQTDEQLDYLPEYYNAVLGFADNDEPDVNIANRAALWGATILGIYALGLLYSDDDEQHIAWALGPTDHCGDCLRLSTIVATREQWRNSEWRPQSRNLECGGYRCQCRLIETDEPIQGSFP